MTYFQIPRGGVGARARVPAGAPIANSEVYVLDRYLEPVPRGLPGEMCFAGRAFHLLPFHLDLKLKHL